VKLKRLILLREKPEAERTFGSLHWGTRLLCHTLEPGLNDVKAPRVDPGWYLCVPHGWEPSELRYKETWALVGHGVSHQEEPGIPRCAVLFHHGNLDRNTKGCILVGMRRGVLEGEPAVLDSKTAMNELRDLIGHNPFGLSIIER
jgi:hypothetical protein